MKDARQDELIALIREQIRPAVGCTEPAAAAYASALAVRALGCSVEKLTVSVSRNILKNAMGVGIPGTDMVGLPIAAALGALCGDADAALAVLHNVKKQDVARARAMVDERRVHVELGDTDQKLYINVLAQGEGHTARAVIEGAHTHVALVERDGVCLSDDCTRQQSVQAGKATGLSLQEIDEFIREVEPARLTFLNECIDMNLTIAQEGLKTPYGIALGQSLMERYEAENAVSEEAYATAMACAAADARMGGCVLPVMSSCGSGNQGLTATLPIIAVCRRRGTGEDVLLKALAYSLLVTIHVKMHLGKLSALCACSVGASIGTACALTWLNGGSFGQICRCIDNVVADVSGVVCDGAKAGCSLKIATGVASAFRGSMLARKNRGAAGMDGIVGYDAESTVDNLAQLCNEGMPATDRVILDILLSK